MSYASVVKAWPDCLPAPEPQPIQEQPMEETVPKEEPPAPLTTLKINGLTEDAREHEIRKLFVPFGYVKRVKLMRDNYTNHCRGFGFITFSTHEQAQQALTSMNGHPYRYQILRLDWSKPRPPRK
jgi:RNA recognition motif-containing protein